VFFYKIVINEIVSTILIGAAPILEIRGAIPLGMGLYGLSPWAAYIFGLVGNMLPVIPLLLFWRYAVGYVGRHSYVMNRFFAWLFARTRLRHTKQFELWGALALFAFVAVPFPVTGAWTATVAAFLFGIPFWKSFYAILLGVAVSGIIVLMLTLGISAFI